MEKQLTPSSANKLSERISKELELLPENRASVFTLEIQQYTKDKSIIDTEVSVSWMPDKKGEPSGLQGITRDITPRKRAEEEKRKLEAQLQRSKKMEAIGTLAGGVAHDLNNILSGIVSYPELLLLDIPSNSPMRKPILTMKKSGEMAVAIVQDLLTLARRGVAVKEVTDLNAIISEYLKSPEFQNMLSFHPGVTIDVHLEKTLFKILGSPVHLSKTVMNLITNAAEAIQNEGTVFISTESQYIDHPMGNYEHINEGDYVVFIVQDTGSGIASADLDKIFEPFFTKKIMGRSGTGLGMAVVWGTVKDHDGHIEVQSAEGKGTTFKIYFPITRQETTLSKSALSIENYRGNGETILIVDDVSLQREIASGMLEILGYRVKSVKSGEEAVEYLKIHSTDLLFLDMVMTPGIDGLETYKRILDLHPNQKAIIASGFSETERVKEAQMLGAGQYLKKPYALEKLGVAVKNELARNRNLEQMGSVNPGALIH